MGLSDQATSNQAGTATPVVARLAGAQRARHRAPAPTRVNWLFSGAMLGAAGWLLILGVAFVALGNWIVAGSLLAGVCLAVLVVWRAGRHARAVAPGPR